MISTRMHGALAVVSLAALVVAGCASIGNNLAQDLAWERWEKCKDVSPGVSLKEIRPDGQVWVTYRTGGELKIVNECLARAAAEQGQRRAALGSPVAAGGRSAVTTAPVLQEFNAPVWKTGDEWAYRSEQPSGASTFVWAVGRTETINGVPHYVIKTGSREIFHRTSDLAISHQRVSGDLTNTYRPSWPLVTFPLTVGKTWETQYTEERPVDRQTEEVALSCVAESEETVTVPAGTFNTVRVYCKNTRTGSLVRRVWFSSQVKHMVKEEAAVSGGMRTRELIAFKLR